MSLSREEVLHIAALSKISLAEDEIETMRTNLSNILDNFKVLETIDTSEVQPTSQPNELFNAIKEDIVAPSLPQDVALANAPHRDGEFFRVHAVMDED
ncbi:MAG: Asp-tRNA(Asn)/Glu-tRNA(Gln) amidotransferase subunit GatC [Dehalococcoidales bacterium]|jgi:aspartyl-tRNA(Asn)/glutamyl-tRNA(Gln) amidotransferase subunit C|nr:Asp-tRNA(Asn)/Glu-tRNA(Gln) amidotransferase subunit GatC [Dehalococcoidales bacterium]